MLQAVVGDMVGMVVVTALLAGIIKLFQIATSLNEIKDLLAQIKRNTQDYAPAGELGLQRRPDSGAFHATLLDSER